MRSSAELHAGASRSAGLAAAIALAISQIIGLIIAVDSVQHIVLYGLSVASIAFGGTYAGVFFVSRARHH